jgi:hypothetical protein
MTRCKVTLVLTLLLVCSTLPDYARAAGPRGQALVVGVGLYSNLNLGTKNPNLTNPEQDARKIAEALTAMGFNVRLLLSSTGTAQRSLIEEAWRTLLSETKPDETALFYFAGHGVELYGRNFLVPQDAVYNASDKGDRLKTLTRTALDFQAFFLAELGARQKKQPGLMGLFIIDACRENPFKDTEKMDESVPVGLKAILPPKDMFVMYSAGIQQFALDGPKDGNSVYADQLLGILGDQKKRESSLANIAQSLRFEVYNYARTQSHTQTPAYYDQLAESRSILGEKRPIELMANVATHISTRDLSAKDIVIDCPYCPEVVTIEGPAGRRYGIGKFEVTNREWDACVRAKKCTGELRSSPGQSRLERLPVTHVSYQDAEDYLKWLTGLTGHAYRLPAEDEWEHAARAGTTTPYSFAESGRALELLCFYANGADRTAGAISSANPACNDGVGREVAPVGTYKPNPFGLSDVHGNVWEWVADCWSPDRKPAIGTAPCATRVARGGSWRSGPEALMSHSRTGFPADHSRATLGFRVLRVFDE